tara:strand:- start:78 stop:659 length:582 start_codon:yes stop_codon:yes gene_type:complete
MSSDEKSKGLKAKKEQAERYAEFHREWEAKRAAAQKVMLGNLGNVWKALKENKIRSVLLEYSGSGDSGQFDYLLYQLEDESERHGLLDCGYGYAPAESKGALESFPVPQLVRSRDFIEGKLVESEGHKDVGIHQALENIGYLFLDQHHGGWENNEGGQGRITWDVGTETMTMEHGQNYMETEESTHEVSSASD